MLTTTQVAERLGITPSRVRQIIREGRLVATKHGRDWEVDPESLDSFVKVRRRVGRPSVVEPDFFPPCPSEVLLCPNDHRLCRKDECWK